jgi:hypothetical protein
MLAVPLSTSLLLLLAAVLKLLRRNPLPLGPLVPCTMWRQGRQLLLLLPRAAFRPPPRWLPPALPFPALGHVVICVVIVTHGYVIIRANAAAPRFLRKPAIHCVANADALAAAGAALAASTAEAAAPG